MKFKLYIVENVKVDNIFKIAGSLQKATELNPHSYKAYSNIGFIEKQRENEGIKKTIMNG